RKGKARAPRLRSIAEPGPGWGGGLVVSGACSFLLAELPQQSPEAGYIPPRLAALGSGLVQGAACALERPPRREERLVGFGHLLAGLAEGVGFDGPLRFYGGRCRGRLRGR